jgi:DNA-binding transcriptional LysR family regulator
MRVRKLDYLIALAKEGHFARAAAVCHVSQPTLSTALRQLEVEMGVTIVKRGQRYCGLTEQGERVLAFAHRVAAECEHLNRELENRHGEAGGTLQVGVIPSAIPFVTKLTTAFHKEYPHVNVRLLELNPSNVQRAFEEFTIDIAATYLYEKFRRLGRNQVMYNEEYTLLVRRGSAFASRKSVSWEDASQLSLCLLLSEMLATNCPVRNLLNYNVANKSFIETNSVSALYSYVRSGMWNAVLPAQRAAELQPISDVECVALPALRDAIPVGLMIADRELSFQPAEAFFKLAVSQKRPVSDKKQGTQVWVNGTGFNRGGEVSSVRAQRAS